MSFTEIEITSNSNLISIKNDFEPCQTSLKLQISLEIQVDQEEIILRSVVEQLQSLIHLEELSIIVSTQCILEQFHILTEGFSQLINLRVFAISFQEECFAGEIHFQHLCVAFQRMTQLIDLRVCVERNNSLNQKSLELLNESFSYLSNLMKLKIAIQEGNQFDAKMAEELAKGLNKMSQLQELELSLDFTYINQKGMKDIGQSLQVLKNLKKLKIVFEGQCEYQGLSNIFQSFLYLSQLKILELQSMRDIDMDEQEAKDIVEYLSKLIHLEQFSLQQTIFHGHFDEYVWLITQLSHFKVLKQLDLEIHYFKKLTEEIAQNLQLAFCNLSITEKLKLQIIDYTKNDTFCTSLFTHSFEKLNKLTSLSLELYCNIFKADSLNLVKSIKNIKNIENLYLDFGYYFYIDEEILIHLRESIQNLTNLRQLDIDLHFNSYDENNHNSGKINLNLMNLRNIEVLKLKNKSKLTNLNEVEMIEGQDILSELKSFEKLRILRFDFFNINKESAQTFSSAFVNLKSLTYLSLSIKGTYKNVREEEYQLRFDSFSSLCSLTNLKLRFIHILSVEESQSLGSSLLSLKNITSFSLQSQLQQLNCLQSILNGFSNSKLRNLKLMFNKMKNIPHTQEDFRLFSSVQFLESIILEEIDLWSDDQNTMVLIDSLKQLNYLKKIKITEVFGYFERNERQNKRRQNILSKTYSSLIQLIQLLPNLLEFEISEGLQKTSIPTCAFDSIQQQKQVKIKDIGLDILFDQQQNRQLHSLMKQLKNLRQLRLHNKFDELSLCNGRPKKYLETEIPKYLTQLEYTISAKLNDMFTYDNLGEELSMIKHLKYLTDLSFCIDLQNFNMLDLIHFGQSLQQINQIRKLSLKFSLQEKCPPEAFIELSKGIASQRWLYRLSIEVGDFQTSSSYQNIISVIESFKQLSYLIDLKLILNKPNRSQNEVCLCNQIFLRLGKNLSFISNLRALSIILSIDCFHNIDEGISSFANVFQSNFSLRTLDISIFGVKIGEKAVQALGNGLKYLKSLQSCSFCLSGSKINDCIGILEGIQNIESLTSITLYCYVERLSYTPLNQILKYHQGVFVSKLSLKKNEVNVFTLQFNESELKIYIQQTSKSTFPYSEYLKLTKQFTNLSPSLDIDLKMKNNNIFNDLVNSNLVLEQQVVFPSISKLTLVLSADNLDLYNSGIVKMEQVKELNIMFRKSNLNNDQIVTALRNLSNSIGQILKLNLLISEKIINDQIIMKNFISAMKQCFSSVKELQLKIYYLNIRQEEFLHTSIKRKLKHLINLKVNHFQRFKYQYYIHRQMFLMGEEEDEYYFDELSDSEERSDSGERSDLEESYSEEFNDN